MSSLYRWHDLIMALHIAMVMAWMAGLLYLPRLFIYHTPAAAGSEMDLTFQKMERLLYRGIMNPAMIVVWLLGLSLIWLDATYKYGWSFLATPWMLTKLAGVLFLTWWHHYLGVARTKIAAGQRPHTERFWRMTNELPFLAAIVMIIAIVTKFQF
ncbi:MAG TPA: CopD family protein [Caulobacteraceae bacterium]|jgi:putative membrane protein